MILQRAPSRGATLIEMLVVLAILAGLAGMATLALKVPPGVVLDRTARGIVSDLEQARTAALTQGQLVNASFEIDARRFSVPDLNLARILPRAVTARVTGAASADQSSTDDRIDISFYPDASTSGADIVLSMRSQSRVISVHWLSGQVRYASD